MSAFKERSTDAVIMRSEHHTMRHLITIDLDGTLLDRQGCVSDRSKSVIDRIRALGHVVVIATGRPFSGAIPKYERLGLDTPLITDNGGSIQNPVDPSFPRQRTSIPKNIMHDLFRFSKDMLDSAFFSLDDVVYAYKYERRLEAFFAETNPSGVVIEQPFDTLDVEPSGIIFLVQASHVKAFENHIDTALSHTLSYRLWGTDMKHAIYEVYLRHISKASAISYLLNHYGIDPSAWIAFGDGTNDVEMIRDAAIGVAMKNACDEVIEVSDDNTSFDNGDDGVARWLEQHFAL
jgi:5-amino-6-(5-phospho-D-ribitylamino)uracil phosphatase